MSGPRSRGRRMALAALVLGGAAVLGCAERRDLPLAPPPPERVTYEGEIRSLFEARCVSCHSGAAPAARYDMTSLEGVRGGGLDGIPNAIPGDAQSLLVTKSLPGQSMNAFYAGPDEVALVEQWVIADSMAVR